MHSCSVSVDRMPCFPLLVSLAVSLMSWPTWPMGATWECFEVGVKYSRPALFPALMPLEVLPGKKQVYRSSQLWLYVHCQDSISSWNTFLPFKKNELFSLYVLDNFSLEEK